MLTSKKYRQCGQCEIDIGSHNVMSVLCQYCIHCEADDIEKEICTGNEWEVYKNAIQLQTSSFSFQIQLIWDNNLKKYKEIRYREYL